MTDDQSTFIIIENQGKSMISNVFVEKKSIHLFSLWNGIHLLYQK